MPNIFDTIKGILWDQSMICVDQDTYVELKNHAIDTLAASSFSRIMASDRIIAEWKKSSIHQIAYNTRCIYLQKTLPITVPYVILKGTSASKYYPHPEYRSLGDIDIITRREDYNIAYEELLNDGYIVVKKLEREVAFKKNGIIVELHKFFASLNNLQQAQYLDDLIIQNIAKSHVLPDIINGLVLLEHIDQHLENGLGLRQIIDWMMFVDKCLPDENWPSFIIHAKSIGLETLAIVITKMCEIYLGLPKREWCNKADEKLCRQLMDYIRVCGNFGITRSKNISIGDNVFYLSSTPMSFFALLQARGLENWEKVHKNAQLKPFAWVYQLFRYIVKGLNREDARRSIKNEYISAKERKRLFRKLGVRQAAKGLTIYRDGKYVKQ